MNKLYSKGFDILDQTPRENGDKVLERPINIVRESLINKLLALKCNTQLYGVTLTFRKMFHDENDQWLHNHVYEELLRSRHCKNLNWILIPEFTPKNVTLHYHGLVYDCYIIEFQKMIKFWRSKYGFVKAELKINHYDKWITYITKDVYKTGLYILYNKQKIISPILPTQ